MTDNEWDRIHRHKQSHRDASAALPISEKLRLLERLRDRAVSLGQLRRSAMSSAAQAAAPHLQTAPSVQATKGSIGLSVSGANASLFAVAASASVVTTRASNTIEQSDTRLTVIPEFYRGIAR